MEKAVYINFEAPLLEVPAKLRGNVVPLRHEAKGGAEAQPLLQVHQLSAVFMAFDGLYIVGQHQGELLPFRPAGPALGGGGRPGVDGPDVGVAGAPALDHDPAQRDLDPARDERFYTVVKLIKFHMEVLPVRGGEQGPGNWELGRRRNLSMGLERRG